MTFYLRAFDFNAKTGCLFTGGKRLLRPSPVFEALSRGPGYMMAQEKGVGSVTESRASVMNTFTHEGRTFQYQGGEVAWEGGRPVRNMLWYSDQTFAGYDQKGGTPAPADGAGAFSAQGFSNAVLFAVPTTVNQYAYHTNETSNVSVGRTYIISLLIKRADSTEPKIRFCDSSVIAETDIQIVLNGSVILSGDVNGYVKTNLGNGVWRYHISTTVSGGSTPTQNGFFLSTAQLGTSNIYVHMYQLEDVTHRKDKTTPSEYVPTAGTAVTRTFTSERSTYLPKNLLLYSEEFDNTGGWGKSRVLVTPNVALAPDGTTTADKLIANTDTPANSHYLSKSLTPPDDEYLTFSYYAKAGEYNYACVYLYATDGVASGNCYYFVNLNTGTVSHMGNLLSPGTHWSDASYLIENKSNGWYRCTITAKIAAAATSIGTMLMMSASGTSYYFIGDGTSGIYVWGAQLESESAGRIDNTTPSPYIKTTTAAADASQVYDRDAATLDVWAVSAPAATNTQTQSRNFSSSWTLSGGGSQASTISIDGTSNAVTITDDNASDYTRLARTTTSVLAAAANEISIIVRIKKKAVLDATSAVALNITGGTGQNAITILDAASGSAVGRATALPDSITVVDGGDWWHLVFTITNNGTNTNHIVTLYGAWDTTLSDGGVVAATEGSTTFDQVEVYDNTSHAVAVGLAKVPIFTSGSAVTRDTCNIKADIANHSDTQGVWFGEAKQSFDGTDMTSARGFLAYGASSGVVAESSTLGLYSYDGTSSLSFVSPAFTLLKDTPYKLGVAYSSADSGRAVQMDGYPQRVGTYDGTFGLSGTVDLDGSLGAYGIAYVRNVRRYDVDYETGKQLLLELTTS